MSKKVNGLMEKLTDEVFILKGINQVLRNARKKSYGKSKHAIRKRKRLDFYEDHMYEIVLDIKNLLESDKYIPNELIRFKRIDPSSGKTRNITAPLFYPDLVVHQLIVNVLKEFVYHEQWHPNNMCTIKGRGPYYGIKRISKFIKSSNAEKEYYARVYNKPNHLSRHKYFLKLDIRKYFESIQVSDVMNLLRHKIKDKKFLILVERILSVDDHLTIGSPFSQYLALLLLDGLDKEVGSHPEVTNYFRYMDDIVVFSKTKKSLWKLLTTVIEPYLNERGLKIKDNLIVSKFTNKTRLDYLGAVFSSDGDTKLRKKIKFRVLKTIRRYNKYINNSKLFRVLSSYLGNIFTTRSYYLMMYFRDKSCKFYKAIKSYKD